MKSIWKWCAVALLATSVVAQSEAPKPKKRAATITAADVQALKDAIASQAAALAQQQQQIQELREELHKKDQAVTQAQVAATDASSKADAAQATVTQQQATVGELKTDVSDLKLNINNTALSLQETQKNVNASLESPAALHFKGITITPGGFLAAEFVRRSRALGSDVNTPFNSLTMPGAAQSSISEFFGSGRQSRLSMLAEGKLADVKLAGYVEADFLSSGTTSNNNQSNSYTLRQRQAWGQAAFNNGFTFTGGQMWSLVTETKHGTDNRSEALPMTIDPQYNVGFSWARQYGLRVSKNFNNKLWLAASMENSQATVTSHGNGNNFIVGSAGTNGGLYNAGISNCTTANNNAGTPITTCSPLASYSFNPSPDVIAKAAFEPGFGHYEVFGIYTRFRDRTYPCGEVALISPAITGPCPNGSGTGPNGLNAVNVSTNGGGIGANARWSLAQKRVDFGVHMLEGRGIGRYGTSTLADAAVRPDGSLDPIRSWQGLATLEYHVPKVDIYFNAGGEYAGRAASFDPVSNANVGYGSPFFNNSGCYSETAPSIGGGFFPGGLSKCTADTRVVEEATIGFWYKFYNGPKGRFQWGPQYSYVTRYAWSGTSTIPGLGSPHGLDGMVFTSFRYYLP
jgi:hypothetical protein